MPDARMFSSLSTRSARRSPAALGAALLLLLAGLLPGFGALKPGDRVAIIGDSITEQKLYSKYMEAYLLACSGVDDLHVFQFGWGGETASGFASRLANDLAPFKPTVATTCYGMNDGSYRPYTEDIGRRYESSMRKVVTGLREAGVRDVVVGSPGAVDTRYFVRDNFKPLSGADGYNKNLATLRDLDRALAADLGTGFADVHQPMIDAMAKAKAALGNDYDVCGKDGFHPGPNGHLIMAYAFLRGLKCDGEIGALTMDLSGSAKASGAHRVVGGSAGKVEFESARYPFCFEGDAKSSSGTRSIAPFLPFNQELNRLTLKVSGLKSARARVAWGAESREFSREQLEAGVNLAAEFERTPFQENFRRLLEAVAAKQNFETSMIKRLITGFRDFSNDAKADPELAAAFAKIGERMAARQKSLHQAARATIEPVRHTIEITAIP